MTPPRLAVVGHVEWVDFARIDRLPRPGEILHAREFWSEPAGGGAVAAVQMARLGADVTLYTALGGADGGQRARTRLECLGVQVLAAPREQPQARAFTYLEPGGERTITVCGDQLVPRGDDDLPWAALASVDAVYFAKGDPAALRAARSARVLVATARQLDLLRATGVPIDALVHSAHDAGEAYHDGDLAAAPRLVVSTEGPHGGSYRLADGRTGRYVAADLPGTAQDAYGCGDSFAAGLTFGLGQGLGLAAALEVAARCGAAAWCRKGAHG